jgi:hypothetical protein
MVSAVIGQAHYLLVQVAVISRAVAIDRAHCLRGQAMEVSDQEIDREMAVTDRTVRVTIDPATSVIGRIDPILVLETTDQTASTIGTNGKISGRITGRKSTTIGAIAGKTIGMIAIIGLTATGGITILATVGIGLATAIGGDGQHGEVFPRGFRGVGVSRSTITMGTMCVTKKTACIMAIS